LLKAIGIASIEPIEIDEMVYNFAVATDHSYVVEGVVSHNCRCFPGISPTQAPAPLNWKAPRHDIIQKGFAMQTTLATLSALMEGPEGILRKGVTDNDLGVSIWDDDDLEGQLVKALKTIKQHQSRTKDGKVEQVKEHTASYDPAELVAALGKQRAAELQAKPSGMAHVKMAKGAEAAHEIKAIHDHFKSTKEGQNLDAGAHGELATLHGAAKKAEAPGGPRDTKAGKPKGHASAADLLARARDAATGKKPKPGPGAAATALKPRKAQEGAITGKGGPGAADKDFTPDTGGAPTNGHALVDPKDINTKSPDHLMAAGGAILAQLRSLNEQGAAGSAQYNHLLTQYNSIRSGVKQFNLTRGASATPADNTVDGGNVTNGKPPAFVTGGADKLKTPKQFEIAAAAAPSKEDATELAHYFERLAHNNGHQGATWDNAWNEIKAAMKTAPPKAQVDAGVDAKGKPIPGAKPMADGLAAAKATSDYEAGLDEMNAHHTDMQRNGITYEERAQHGEKWAAKIDELKEKTGKGTHELTKEASKRKKALEAAAKAEAAGKTDGGKPAEDKPGDQPSDAPSDGPKPAPVADDKPGNKPAGNQPSGGKQTAPSEGSENSPAKAAMPDDEYNGHLDELNGHASNMHRNGITTKDKRAHGDKFGIKLADLAAASGKTPTQVIEDAAKRQGRDIKGEGIEPEGAKPKPEALAPDGTPGTPGPNTPPHDPGKPIPREPGGTPGETRPKPPKTPKPKPKPAPKPPGKPDKDHGKKTKVIHGFIHGLEQVVTEHERENIHD
jgi:hypothetical protein